MMAVRTRSRVTMRVDPRSSTATAFEFSISGLNVDLSLRLTQPDYMEDIACRAAEGKNFQRL
jgi:hypothetical protein